MNGPDWKTIGEQLAREWSETLSILAKEDGPMTTFSQDDEDAILFYHKVIDVLSHCGMQKAVVLRTAANRLRHESMRYMPDELDRDAMTELADLIERYAIEDEKP
jgi:hypothetical protein